MYKTQKCKKIKNSNYLMCEADKSVSIVTPRWMELLVYIAVLIYEIVNHTDYTIKDFSLHLQPFEQSIQLLSNNTYDVHAGLYTPIQFEFYKEHLVSNILLEHSYYNSQRSLLLVNRNSKLTPNDIGVKRLTIYISPTDAGDYQLLLDKLNNAKIDMSKLSFVFANTERELYNILLKDKNAIVLSWTSHPLYDVRLFRELSIRNIVKDDFIVSDIGMGVNKNFRRTDAYNNVLGKYFNGITLQDGAFKLVGKDLVDNVDGVITVEYLYGLVDRLNGKHRQYMKTYY